MGVERILSLSGVLGKPPSSPVPPACAKSVRLAKSTELHEHVRKSRAVARALDQKADALPYAKTFTSYEFQDFLSQLTPKRFELLRLASKGRRSIADLATAAHRDQSAVSRDVAKLSQLGLVKVEVIINEGHGRKKIVMPVATTISINALIAAD
jgi:predicted transcriptional regulator